MRKTITLDFDGVVTNPYPQTINYINWKLGTSLATRDMYFSDSGGRTEISTEMLSRAICDYFRTAGAETFPLHDGVVGGIRRLAEISDVHVVTSCADWWLPNVRTILELHFKGLVSGLHTAISPYHNNYRTGERKQKSAVCLSLQSLLMIEDDLQHARDCYDAGIRTLILNPYVEKDASDIPILSSWSEVVEKALGILGD